MKLLYTHPNRILVENARNIVENAGIGTRLENEFAGGGIGELAPINAWLELWVVRDRDYETAEKLLVETLKEEDGPDWRCPACGEINSPAFEFCWNCHGEKPMSGPGRRGGQ